MKKFLTISLIVSLFLFSVFPVTVHAIEDEIISVNSSAQISIVPDTAKINIDIVSSDTSAEKAQKKSNKKVKEVLSSLELIGINKSDLVTSDFYVRPEYDYNQSKIISYQVTYTLNVLVKNIDMISKIIDTALSNGASNTYNIEYMSNKSEETYLIALEQAIKKSKEKADVIAKASNLEILRVESVEEVFNNPQMNYKRSYDLEASGADSAMEILSRNIIIEAEVNVCYKIK